MHPLVTIAKDKTFFKPEAIGEVAGLCATFCAAVSAYTVEHNDELAPKAKTALTRAEVERLVGAREAMQEDVRDSLSRLFEGRGSQAEIHNQTLFVSEFAIAAVARLVGDNTLSELLPESLRDAYVAQGFESLGMKNIARVCRIACTVK